MYAVFICKVIKDSQPGVFLKAHNVRKMATSLVFFRNMKMGDICKRVKWASARVYMSISEENAGAGEGLCSFGVATSQLNTLVINLCELTLIFYLLPLICIISYLPSVISCSHARGITLLRPLTPSLRGMLSESVPISEG